MSPRRISASSIRRRRWASGDGWVLDVRMVDDRGDRNRTRTSFRTRAEASAYLEQLRAEVMSGAAATMRASTVPFSRLCDEYINDLRGHARASTVGKEATYCRIAANLVGGSRPVGHISTQDLGRAIARGDRYAPATRAEIGKLLKRVFGAAVTWGYTDTNPASGIVAPRVPETIREVTADEVQQLLRACESVDAIVGEPRMATWFLVSLYTGLRQGEVAALRWADLDLAGRTLRVQPRDGWAPKSGRSRVVGLSPVVVDALERWRPHSRGPLVLGETSDRPWTRVRRLAGVWCRAHDLRHTFAIALVRAGTPLPVVQQLLGHSAPSTTLMYLRFAPDAGVRAVDVLDWGAQDGQKK